MGLTLRRISDFGNGAGDAVEREDGARFMSETQWARLFLTYITEREVPGPKTLTSPRHRLQQRPRLRRPVLKILILLDHALPPK